jgi:hypothetical protein
VQAPGQVLGRPVPELLVVLGLVAVAVLAVHVGQQHVNLLLRFVQVQVKVGYVLEREKECEEVGGVRARSVAVFHSSVPAL